jgi:hypothetical protein
MPQEDKTLDLIADLINGAVMLSEAKHLCLFPVMGTDPNLIRDSSLRSE